MSFLLRTSLLILLASFPGASTADFSSTEPSESTIRAATAACVKTSAPVPAEVLGISDPHASAPEVINIIADAGVNWVRAEFHWSLIEPVSGGGYRWEPYDRMVRAYMSRGIRVQAVLTYIPDSQPRDWSQVADAFYDFVAATVDRYAPMGVHYWEIFNEPNLPGYGWLSRNHSAQPTLATTLCFLPARTERCARGTTKAWS